MNGVDGAGAGVGEYGDEHMLLDVEGAGIERELPPAPPEEDAVGDLRRHELAQRHDGDLSGDGGDRQRLRPVPEELVQEGEQDAGEGAEEPHSEGEDREGGVVGGGDGERHLLDRRVLGGLIGAARCDIVLERGCWH